MSQADCVRQCCLKTQTGVLPRALCGIVDLQTPVRPVPRLWALNKMVAEFVQDHLRDAVISIQGFLCPQRQCSSPVPRGKNGIVTADHHSNLCGTVQPDQVQRILIGVGYFSSDAGLR
ncbi:MAG TPA: hypothetical protein DCG12_11555 [Planctomycetaceae bacterium]|nr:hypothetical protein [Planctomycetaceae bacterium]